MLSGLPPALARAQRARARRRPAAGSLRPSAARPCGTRSRLHARRRTRRSRPPNGHRAGRRRAPSRVRAPRRDARSGARTSWRTRRCGRWGPRRRPPPRAARPARTGRAAAAPAPSTCPRNRRRRSRRRPRSRPPPRAAARPPRPAASHHPPASWRKAAEDSSRSVVITEPRSQQYCDARPAHRRRGRSDAAGPGHGRRARNAASRDPEFAERTEGLTGVAAVRAAGTPEAATLRARRRCDLAPPRRGRRRGDRDARRRRALGRRAGGRRGTSTPSSRPGCARLPRPPRRRGAKPRRGSGPSSRAGPGAPGSLLVAELDSGRVASASATGAAGYEIRAPEPTLVALLGGRAALIEEAFERRAYIRGSFPEISVLSGRLGAGAHERGRDRGRCLNASELGDWLADNEISSVRLIATNHDGLALGKYVDPGEVPQLPPSADSSSPTPRSGSTSPATSRSGGIGASGGARSST